MVTPSSDLFWVGQEIDNWAVRVSVTQGILRAALPLPSTSVCGAGGVAQVSLRTAPPTTELAGRARPTPLPPNGDLSI